MNSQWIVCQLGAREHYAIPRALCRAGALRRLVTDAWVPPGSLFSRLPFGQRLKERYHPDLISAPVKSFTGSLVRLETVHRILRQDGWTTILERNAFFEQKSVASLRSQREAILEKHPPVTLFSYAYAARDLFRYAKQCGWQTVLGQIDPGPTEERLVQEEHERYPEVKSRWEPAPEAYWERWREEIALADRVLVNSEWSKQCLCEEGVPEAKLEVIPLVYEAEVATRECENARLPSSTAHGVFQLLFLGQINLRKGIARLLEAMRRLREEPIELTLAGPSEIDPSAWQDLPNVRWLGAVPRSGVSELYKKADAFILPTLSDGFALTQLEARSHGLPLLVSPHCGEVVQEASDGWVMRDCEIESIVEVIRKAMDQHGERTTGSATAWRGKTYSLEALSMRLLGEAR